MHTFENLRMFSLGIGKVYFFLFLVFLYFYPLVKEHAFLLYT